MHGYDANQRDFEYPSPLINTACDNAYDETTGDNHRIDSSETVNFEQLIGH